MSDLTERLLERHPLRYGKPGEMYERCPVCEEWSPCDVRRAADRLNVLERVGGVL